MVYFALESGGQSLRTSNGLPPLCTVGAAELDPPASGSTALFSTAMELAVFSSPLPEVAAPVVVQLVSALFLSPDGAAVWAEAAPAAKDPARIAIATREIIFVSSERKIAFQIQETERSAGN
jgi:hypothetical protein